MKKRGGTEVVFRYGYVAALSGGVSLLLSVASLITSSGLEFHFGYVLGRIDLTVGDNLFHTLLWLTSLLVFSVYPIVKRTQLSRVVLVGHGLVPVLASLMLLRPETSPLLAIDNIIICVMALRGSSQTLGLPVARAVNLFAAAILGTVLVVEVLSSLSLLVNPFSALTLYSGSAGGLAAAGRLDLNLFSVASSLMSWLLLCLMASAALAVAGRLPWDLPIPRSASSKARGRNYLLVGLGVVVVSTFAGLVGFLPYFLRSTPVGVDAGWYSEKLGELATQGSTRSLMNEPRALSLLFFYAIQLSGLSVPETIKVGTVFLSALFALSNLFCVNELTQRRDQAFLAAILACVSIQTLVATIAAIFDNWLALAEVILFFGFLFRNIRTSKSTWLLGAFVMSLVVMLTHAWTWSLLMLILAVHILFSAAKEKCNVLRSAEMKILAGSGLIGLILYTFGSLATTAFRDAIKSGFQSVLLGNLQWPNVFFANLHLTFTDYVGGFFANWLVFSLSIVGVLGIAGTARKAQSLLGLWVLCPSLMAIFLSAFIQWRLLFLIPYNVFAAIGVFVLLDRLQQWTMKRSSAPADLIILNVVQLTFLVCLLVAFWNNAVRAMVFIASNY
jgi:hypothetical protein